MSDVLTINSSTINLVTANAQLDRLIPYVKGGIPELHLSKLLGKLIALPDPWSGKPCTLTMGGTLVFSGDIQGYGDHYDEDVGWIREYRALGLRNRADYIPNTDAVTLTDTSVYNLPGDDPNFIGSRAGLTVGQIVTAVLTMAANATALTNAGIGNYTSFGPAVLPTITANDLANLTVIPASRVAIYGERILQSIESFVQQWHPNHWMHIDPSGNIRFFDLRTASNATLTLGSDPRLGMPSLTRDFSDCYSQVEVRGNTIAVPMTLQTAPWPGSTSTDGGLQEDFAWGALTNAAAKAAWVPADYNQPTINGGDANDQGTCTCPDTTHVIVTSQDNTLTWPANFWGQGGSEAQGQIYLYADIITGISQLYAARIVANTALTAGGTSTLTLDRALPAITYNAYQIFGLAENASVVYRKYKVTNANIASAMLNFFPYPVPIRGAAGNAAAMTSTPTGFVQWSNSGARPYNTSSLGITVDPVNGLVYFDRPTALVFGSQVTAPNNVMAFLAVANGSLSVFAPSSSTYGGTLDTLEGIQRTKVITITDWKDASNTSNMQTYCNEFFDSVKNVVVEGTLPYYGLLTTYLTTGTASYSVSIAGNDTVNAYTTGYESLVLNVISAEVQFNNGQSGTSYTMALHLSNRRGRYTAENFLRPNVTGQMIGADQFFAGGAPSIATNPFTGDASNWQVGGALGAGGNAESFQVGGAAYQVGGEGAAGSPWSTNIESPTGPSSAWDTTIH